MIYVESDFRQSGRDVVFLKTKLALLLALLLMFAAGSALADTHVMMYMCGSDLQSSCLDDIQEMT